MALRGEDPVLEPRISTEQIIERFDAGYGTWEERKASESIRTAYQDLAARINNEIEDSRAKSEALTLLESASMWTQKAIFENLPVKKPKPFLAETQEPQRVYVWMGGRDQKLVDFLGDRFKTWATENVSGQVKDLTLLTFIDYTGTVQELGDDRCPYAFEKLASGAIVFHK